MADSSTATAAADDSEQQITFNIKSSSDAKHVLTLPVSTTVADLKQKLSTEEYANVPPERQRLIYSGRVLKDHDTIGGCKIKDGNTVHLVKSAESNQRQNPVSQPGSTASILPGAGQPANNVPSNIAAGTRAGDPLAQLTGARYAGFHGLPGMDTFGADGGMGAPPNPDQMLRLLDDPNFASQMNEAMNNPAVLDMLRNNPMIRNNPMARAAIENPELRRMMFDPNMIRMQMQMQRAMGGDGGTGGQAAFPMPGQTDTTQQTANSENMPSNTTGSTGQTNTGSNQQTPANPFAALFPGAGGPPRGNAGGTNTEQNQQQNPFAGLFGQPPGGQQQQTNPIFAMANQMMQNPEMMQQMQQMMGGGGAEGLGGAGAFNPWAALGGAGAMSPPEPQDDRPPEVRYESQLRQLNDMGFYEFERNVQALRRSGGNVQGAVEYLLGGS